MEELRETVDNGLSELLAIAEEDVRSATTDEERARAVKIYSELYDRYISAVKLDQTSEENADKYLEEFRRFELEKEKLEKENERKDEELKTAKRDGWIKLGLGVIGTALPLWFQNLWLKRMMEAEKIDGPVVMQTSRSIFQNLFKIGKK